MTKRSEDEIEDILLKLTKAGSKDAEDKDKAVAATVLLSCCGDRNLNEAVVALLKDADDEQKEKLMDLAALSHRAEYANISMILKLNRKCANLLQNVKKNKDGINLNKIDAGHENANNSVADESGNGGHVDGNEQNNDEGSKNLEKLTPADIVMLHDMSVLFNVLKKYVNIVKCNPRLQELYDTLFASTVADSELNQFVQYEANEALCHASVVYKDNIAFGRKVSSVGKIKQFMGDKHVASIYQPVPGYASISGLLGKGLENVGISELNAISVLSYHPYDINVLALMPKNVHLTEEQKSVVLQKYREIFNDVHMQAQYSSSQSVVSKGVLNSAIVTKVLPVPYFLKHRIFKRKEKSNVLQQSLDANKEMLCCVFAAKALTDTINKLNDELKNDQLFANLKQPLIKQPISERTRFKYMLPDDFLTALANSQCLRPVDFGKISTVIDLQSQKDRQKMPFETTDKWLFRKIDELYAQIMNAEVPGDKLHESYMDIAEEKPEEILHRSKRDVMIEKIKGFFANYTTKAMLDNNIVDDKNLNNMIGVYVDKHIELQKLKVPATTIWGRFLAFFSEIGNWFSGVDKDAAKELKSVVSKFQQLSQQHAKEIAV